MPSNTRSLRAFAASHDDLPAFHAGYIVLTFIVAALFRLGTFALIIGAHMALDAVKYREFHQASWYRTARAVCRESLSDIALFSIGLACAVYFHHSLPVIATVSGISRSMLSLLGAVGTTVPKWEIANHFVRTIRSLPGYMHDRGIKAGSPLEKMECFCLFAIVFNLVLIVVAPLLLGTGMENILSVIVSEMRLW